MIPAWTSRNTPNPRSMDESMVFFFPAKHETTEEKDGWITPKLYKKQHLSKAEQDLKYRDKKRRWRSTSSTLQKQLHWREYPRDENGRIMVGVHTKRLNRKMFR